MKNLTAYTFAGAFLAAQLLSGGPVLAKKAHSPRITATTSVKSVNALSETEQQAVSLSAGRLLVHTDRARLDIAGKNSKQAMEEVSKGLQLIRIIDNAMPKYKTVTDIKAGKEYYRSEDNISQRYVVVFNEQYIEDIITPITDAKKVEKATSKTRKSKPLKKGDNENGAYADISLIRFTSLQLDLVAAETYLSGAQKELKKGELKKADEFLQNLQEGAVTILTSTAELPLAEASQNLNIAQIEIRDGKHKQALQTLKTASSNLKEYEKITDKGRAKEVKALLHEIDQTTKALEEEKNLEAALKSSKKKFNSWWQRTLKWHKK